MRFFQDLVSAFDKGVRNWRLELIANIVRRCLDDGENGRISNCCVPGSA